MGSSLYLQGGAATQNTLKDTLTQVSHGFTVGSAIRYNAASSQWVTARANNAENAEVVGVVSEVQTVDSFTVVYSGVINIPALAGVSHPALFLSDTVPGGITHNPPSVIGSVVKPVVVRSVSNDGGYVVVNYLGTQIGGSSTVAIDQIQPVGTIMPFAGTAIPDTWLECNAQPVGVTVYPELYDKVLHSALPRAPIYGHRVNLVGTGLVTANFAVGDIVQFKSTSTAWSGGAYDSNATVLGKIISLTSSTNTTAASSMVVETLPIYNSTTKTFYHPNVVFGAGNGAATATAAATGYRILTTAGAYRSGNPNLVVSTTSIINFLTPNLQGKFPLGTNDVADGDELTPSGSGFYNAASARTIGDIGGQEETLAGTQVATSTTTGLFATTVATGLREPNMPPFLTTKYIIKAKPYARAAIIDDVDVDYTRLLVTDLRSGIQRGAGVGEDLVFKTNTSLSTSGTERMRLTNDGKLVVGYSSAVTTPNPLLVFGSQFSANYPVNAVLMDTDNPAVGKGGGIAFAGKPSTSSDPASSSGRALFASIGGYKENSTDGDYAGYLSLNTRASLGSSSVERVRITSTGNVGVGTNSPTSPLHVSTTQPLTNSVFVQLHSPSVDPTGFANRGNLVIANGTVNGSRQIQFGVSDTHNCGWIGGWLTGHGGLTMSIQPWGGRLFVGATASGFVNDPSTTVGINGDLTIRESNIIVNVDFRTRANSGWARGILFTDGFSPQQSGSYPGVTAGIGLHGSVTNNINTPTALFMGFGSNPWGGTRGISVRPDGKVGIGQLPSVALDVVGEARTSVSTTATSNAKTLVTKDYADSLVATQSAATNGYTKVGNVLIQWGRVYFDGAAWFSGNGIKTITFPRAFSALPWSISSTPQLVDANNSAHGDWGAGHFDKIGQVRAVTTSTAQIVLQGTQGGNPGIWVYWMVIGPW